MSLPHTPIPLSFSHPPLFFSLSPQPFPTFISFTFTLFSTLTHSLYSSHSYTISVCITFEQGYNSLQVPSAMLNNWFFGTIFVVSLLILYAPIDASYMLLTSVSTSIAFIYILNSYVAWAKLSGYWMFSCNNTRTNTTLSERIVCFVAATKQERTCVKGIHSPSWLLKGILTPSPPPFVPTNVMFGSKFLYFHVHLWKDRTALSLMLRE